MSRQRAYQSGDIELRAIHVVDMASQLGTEGFYGVSTFDPLGEFLEAVLDDGKKHQSLADLAVCVMQGRDPEDVDEDMNLVGELMASSGFYGMAVKFGTPVRYFHSESSCSSGWGSYYTQWVYAESFEAAWELGVAWAEKSAADDLAKFKAKSKDGKNGGAA